MPASGCNAISSEGVCFKHFTTSGGNYHWHTVSSNCINYGYDNLASISSLEENTMVLNTSPYNGDCWIGLNDASSEGTYVWVDGSESTYRAWGSGQPYSGTSYYDEVVQDSAGNWKTAYDHTNYYCYICRTNSKCLLVIL